MMKRAGFTLIDLSITLMLISLLMLGVFTRFIDLAGDSRVSSTKHLAGSLQTALQFARTTREVQAANQMWLPNYGQSGYSLFFPPNKIWPTAAVANALVVDEVLTGTLSAPLVESGCAHLFQALLGTDTRIETAELSQEALNTAASNGNMYIGITTHTGCLFIRTDIELHETFPVGLAIYYTADDGIIDTGERLEGETL